MYIISEYMMKEYGVFMEEQIGVKNEITLSELFRILWRRVLILILAFVIGLIAGGVFGALKTWNVHYYGTQVKFYINPNKSENADVETGSQYGIYGAYNKPVMESMVELLNSESFSETLLLDDNGMPSKDVSAIAALPTEIVELMEAGDAKAVLDAWRKTKHYQKTVAFVSNATTYSCMEESLASTANNLAKSFIIVDISVLNGKKQAEFLLDRVKSRVPAYVVKNMARPDGFDTTSCERITRLDDVDLLNRGDLQSTTIKYALLLGAATLLAACAAVIVVDYSDKRLRNFERTMEQLGVPVLGVIPTIVENAPEAQTDKEVAR